MTTDLDAALIAAHQQHDAPHIARLFEQAGNLEAAAGNEDAACFFWTNGYIWALEAGIPLARDLHNKLRERGREA